MKEAFNLKSVMDIKAECERLTHEPTAAECGMFRIKSANETIKEASLRPNPNPLWLTLWYEGEVCCLFADSGVGKSIYAVQISTEIAKTEKVLYFDFELSDKQFQLRYTDEDGHLYNFPSNLYRIEVNPDSMDVADFEDEIISNIEGAAIKTGAKVLIIDNLTWLCNNSEKGDAAGMLMMRLMKLKKKYGWSVLVLAHTPKRAMTNPITQNDLAGSKKLYNFFDSVFSIGFSAKDANLRYLKQLKVRYGDYTYNADNVPVYQIEKVGSFTQFVFVEYSTEGKHLKVPTDSDNNQLAIKVAELSVQGKSIRDIANILGLSKSKVGRLIKK